MSRPASSCLTSCQPILGELTEQSSDAAGGEYDPGLLEQPFSLKPGEAASFIVRSVGKVVTGAVAPLPAIEVCIQAASQLEVQTFCL